VYVQIHVLSQLGTKNLTSAEAAEESPDAHQIDLFNAIEQKSFPKWDICFQQMTQQQQQERNIPVFDLTKTWSRKDFPLQPLGELELNTNVSNYFAEVRAVCCLCPCRAQLCPFVDGAGRLQPRAPRAGHGAVRRPGAAVAPVVSGHGLRWSFLPSLTSPHLSSYPDAHRHRVGVNYQQIPVNQPLVPICEHPVARHMYRR
jgi:catalase